MIKLIECPRDALQGIKPFIPTSLKIEYLNQLLQVGFDTLDFGSFVSPKAIPQMRDTAEVLKGLDLSTSTRLLAIVANTRGASQAVEFAEKLQCVIVLKDACTWVIDNKGHKYVHDGGNPGMATAYT